MLKQALVYSSGELVNRLGKPAAVVLLAAMLSKEQYGIYSYAFAMSGVVLAFLDAGLNTLVILRCNRQHFARLFVSIAACKLLVAIVVLLLVVVWNGAAPIFRHTGTQILLPFLLMSALSDASAFLANSLRALHDFHGEAWLKANANLGLLAVLLLFLAVGWAASATAALWIHVVVLAAAVAYGSWRLMAKRTVRSGSHPRHARAAMAAVVTISLPFAAANVFGSFFSFIDSLVLGHFGFFEVNATFSLAHRIGLLCHFPVGLVMGFLLPLWAERRTGSTRTARVDLQRSYIVLLAVGAVLVSQVYVLGVSRVLTLFLDGAYADLRATATVLSGYVVPHFSYSLISTALLARRHILVPSMLFAVATVLSLVLDWLIVTHIQATLVMYVTVLANWFLLLAFIFLFRFRVREWPLWPQELLAVVALGAVVIALANLPPTVTGDAIRAGVALVSGGMLLRAARTMKFGLTDGHRYRGADATL